MKRSQEGISLVELLISITIISTILVVILNFYNAMLRNTNRFQQQSQLKFLAEEEIEKMVSIRYDDQSLQAYSTTAGLTNFYEREEYLIKTNVVLIDPATGELPERYPTKKEEDTYLKKITVSVARKDRTGGQVDMVYLKSP